ncbi:hypothetical protein SAMN02799615_00880 [Dyella marensis]|uniref:Uncharacterized protein n=1 Tax=Dyella marensis TaxID=500610 RepID=A0A1I2A0R7_9GAMM|nr:hypothetical protein SAMN02799615_00880 [Dyella marensis]
MRSHASTRLVGLFMDSSLVVVGGVALPAYHLGESASISLGEQRLGKLLSYDLPKLEGCREARRYQRARNFAVAIKVVRVDVPCACPFFNQFAKPSEEAQRFVEVAVDSPGCVELKIVDPRSIRCVRMQFCVSQEPKVVRGGVAHHDAMHLVVVESSAAFLLVSQTLGHRSATAEALPCFRRYPYGFVKYRQQEMARVRLSSLLLTTISEPRNDKSGSDSQEGRDSACGRPELCGIHGLRPEVGRLVRVRDGRCVRWRRASGAGRLVCSLVHADSPCVLPAMMLAGRAPSKAEVSHGR